MSNATLSFTTLQGGTARLIEFPLHPLTANSGQVGKLLADLLETITQQTENDSRISDGDVLQSLCMTLAVRMNMVEVPSRSVRDLVSELLEQAGEAVTASSVKPAGTA